MNQVAEIKVEGMQCDACTRSVERAVGRLEGVEDVSVDLTSAFAKVTYDTSRVKIADLNEAIEAAGFEVTVS